MNPLDLKPRGMSADEYRMYLTLGPVWIFFIQKHGPVTGRQLFRQYVQMSRMMSATVADKVERNLLDSFRAHLHGHGQPGRNGS